MRPRISPSPPDPGSPPNRRWLALDPPLSAVLSAVLPAVLPLGAWLAAPATSAGQEAEKGKDSPYFVDYSAEAGLDFRHWNGMSGQWYFPEINGAGAALFDYDGDGDLDAYLVQGARLGPTRSGGPDPGGPAASMPPEGVAHPDGVVRDRLLRNDLGPDGPRFVDVTLEVGLDARGYGMAVAAADFDNDGWIDLYLANVGANQLWRNLGPDARGRFRFVDVTEAWQADDRRWSSALAVADFDRDGWLDLYVGNYLRFELGRQKECRAASGLRDYCHPSSYRSEPDLLFHNRGDRFVDVSASGLPERGAHPTLGLGVTDANGDGWLDLYVANDDRPNQLWRNRARPGEPPGFDEEALLAGSAVDGRGQPEASMGVAVGDFDNDGDEDLFLSHLVGQSNTLYVNDGGLYRDQTARRGLGAPSLPHTGFGTAFVDIDLDGWLDLVVVNGAVQAVDAQRRAGDPYPFHERDQLFRNQGPSNGAGPVFEEVGAHSGLGASRVSRGLAVGDVDDDGDDDLLILDNESTARLLLGQASDRAAPTSTGDPPWVGLRLLDHHGRDALGAHVALERRDAPTLWRRVGVDGSYASSSDPRLRFGLAAGDQLVRCLVHWPDGRVETFPPPRPGRYLTLVAGEGQPGASAPTDAVPREGKH